MQLEVVYNATLERAKVKAEQRAAPLPVTQLSSRKRSQIILERMEREPEKWWTIQNLARVTGVTVDDVHAAFSNWRRSHSPNLRLEDCQAEQKGNVKRYRVRRVA